ncbi:transglutaminaseTgpA domain-containing protein [Streptomyces sp. TRM 70351]|uniref:transglutaminase family protein n=1 Tax=Streptomyces sp. TRM 70351 TaxID=3116552 RepID=UPI002E7C2536|nr:transglutaminaseTgpA domain-containing protein [Streptomyces sp. TRM 70351]MEE1928749.1 transglutaminaseTgpA domain-containing protein [Streptomyces sp. TRM 70351]
MSGQGRLTVCAWLATLAAATALLPLVEGYGWLAQAAVLLAGQGAVGAAARRVPLPRPLTVAAQAVTSLLLLTLVFVRESAVALVVPGPRAWEHFAALLARGAEDVGQFAIPAPVSDGIRLMLVAGVLLIGLFVDVLAVTYRSSAPAGLPLLALFSVAAGLGGQDSGSWLWFLCAAAGYLLLLLAEARDRLAQWGEVFTGRPGAPADPGSPAHTGRRIGVAALGLALVVPVLLPSLGTGLIGPSGGAGNLPGTGSTVSAVNPVVALQDSLNQPEDRTVLTYGTDPADAGDEYLRIVALDQFDGAAWKPSERRIEEVPGTLPPPPGLASDVAGEVVTTRIRAADWYRQNWLPMPYPAQRVSIDGRWRFEPEGRTLVGDRGQTTEGAQYEVESLRLRPTAEQLAGAPRPPAGLLREYTEVPGALPAVVRDTAYAVTGAATSDYGRAVALQEWFARSGSFTYDTQVEAGSGTEAIVRFLEQREGFCVHFAFSMAAMARTLDIPARVAVGFTSGTALSDGTREVGLRDAHAWPELYFEGVGWTRFEPTPSRGSTPEYASPALPAPDATEGPELPSPEATTAPRPQPLPRDGCPEESRRAGECGDAELGAAPSGDDGSRPWWWLLAGAAVLLVLALALLPLLWRERARSGRLAAPGQRPAPGRAPDPRAGVLAAWREVLDSAWDHGVPPDASRTPRQAAERIIAEGRLPDDAAAAAHRLTGAVEAALYAPAAAAGPGHPADGGLAADVRRVRAGLRASADRGTRVRARLLPRSSVRVVWAATERCAAVADAVRAPLRRAGTALGSLRPRARAARD